MSELLDVLLTSSILHTLHRRATPTRCSRNHVVGYLRHSPVLSTHIQNYCSLQRNRLRLAQPEKTHQSVSWREREVTVTVFVCSDAVHFTPARKPVSDVDRFLQPDTDTSIQLDVLCYGYMVSPTSLSYRRDLLTTPFPRP